MAYSMSLRKSANISRVFLLLKQLLMVSKKDTRTKFMNVAPALLFHNGGPYCIETSQLICYANHWTGFYMAGTFVLK